MEADMKRFTAEHGTVSHGTLNPEHLIRRFMDTLDELKESESLSKYPNVARYARIDARLANMERRMAKPDYYESEEADWDLEELFELLSEYAPDGCYFGAHVGDGADFGFWMDDDSE